MVKFWWCGDSEGTLTFDQPKIKGQGEITCLAEISVLMSVMKNFAQHTSTAQLMSHDDAKYTFIHLGIHSEFECSFLSLSLSHFSSNHSHHSALWNKKIFMVGCFQDHCKNSCNDTTVYHHHHHHARHALQHYTLVLGQKKDHNCTKNVISKWWQVLKDCRCYCLATRLKSKSVRFRISNNKRT